MPLYIFNHWDADEEESLIRAASIQLCSPRALGEALCPADLASARDATKVHGCKLAAREEKNLTFGSGSLPGTMVGSGTSLESSPNSMAQPPETPKVSEALPDSKSI